MFLQQQRHITVAVHRWMSSRMLLLWSNLPFFACFLWMARSGGDPGIIIHSGRAGHPHVSAQHFTYQDCSLSSLTISPQSGCDDWKNERCVVRWWSDGRSIGVIIHGEEKKTGRACDLRSVQPASPHLVSVIKATRRKKCHHQHTLHFCPTRECVCLQTRGSLFN